MADLPLVVRDDLDRFWPRTSAGSAPRWPSPAGRAGEVFRFSFATFLPPQP